MKKNTYTIITVLGVFGMFILAASASAASTLSFSPASVRVRAGETFTVKIAVDPQGVKIYTVKTEVNFPADLVKADAFAFGNNWLPLAQPGYDALDNGAGILVKTAGYPSGVSTPVTFGTISFTAKKDGNGIIKTTGNSLALDAGNQNMLSGNAIQLPIAIERLAEKTAPQKTEGITPGTSKTEEATPPAPSLQNPSTETSGVVKEKEAAGSASLFASIGNALSLGTSKILAAFVAGAVVSALLISVIAYFIKRSRKKKKGKL